MWPQRKGQNIIDLIIGTPNEVPAIMGNRETLNPESYRSLYSPDITLQLPKVRIWAIQLSRRNKRARKRRRRMAPPVPRKRCFCFSCYELRSKLFKGGSMGTIYRITTGDSRGDNGSIVD